uniref:Uncharacterized protein n=2 Tax=Anguilla anguilla TaxID=7936 RepID=A0A0E9T8V3_ANGAN
MTARQNFAWEPFYFKGHVPVESGSDWTRTSVVIAQRIGQDTIPLLITAENIFFLTFRYL